MVWSCGPCRRHCWQTPRQIPSWPPPPAAPETSAALRMRYYHYYYYYFTLFLPKARCVCRQAACKSCQIPTPCWTRQIQARPNQPWARCSVLVPPPASRGQYAIYTIEIIPCAYIYHNYMTPCTCLLCALFLIPVHASFHYTECCSARILKACPPPCHDLFIHRIVSSPLFDTAQDRQHSKLLLIVVTLARQRACCSQVQLSFVCLVTKIHSFSAPCTENSWN